MSKNILFWPDVYLEQGHWLPTVVWAEGLRAAGHAVGYMGIRDCAQVVLPFGYKERPTEADHGPFHVVFEGIYPLGYTRENPSSPGGRWKPDHLFAIAAGALDAIFAGDSRPDLLVSGYFTALESLMLHYKYGVDFVLSTTYLRHPQEDPAIRAIQNLLGLPRPVARKLMKSAMGTDWNESMEIEDFVKPLEQVVELVPCPSEFDFSEYKQAETFRYVEPCITPDEHTAAEVEFWNRIPVDKTLVYATVGSQVQDYQGKAEHLFRQLIDMMNYPQMAKYHLVLGVGPALAKKSWGNSTRYTVGGWVPQRSILRSSRTALAIVHGGLATLKECIYFDKPFVVVPMGKDQVDNSLRARRSGVGAIGNADTLDPVGLMNLVNQTVSDRWMNARRSSMSAQFHAAEELKPGLSLLLSRLG